MTTGPDDARAGFQSTFGAEPTGVWSAPGRVNLIGEHTDYNDGFVLPMAIGRRTWVALRRRSDHTARVASAAQDGLAAHDLNDISRESVAGWAAYVFGTAWGLQRAGGERLGGFDAYVASDVPLGAGLSSSAALECALAVGLADLWDLDLDTEALLTATHRAENEIVGAPTGILDQSAALFSKADHALFVDCRDGRKELIPFDLAGDGLRLVVLDTGVTHAHADGGYAERRTACEEVARALHVPALRDVSLQQLEAARSALDPVAYRRARHVVTENDRVLATVERLRATGPSSIGPLLVGSHISMRDDFEISVAEVDTAVEAALEAGALGARMTGGGFGGCVIALVDAADTDRVGKQVEEAFAAQGFAGPAIFIVEPGDGARRDS